MIAKILPSAERTFGGVIGYNLKEQSELVSIENFPYMNVRMAYKYFKDLQKKNSRVRDQVFHGMLSFPKDEKIDSYTEMEIVKDYMKAMGYGEQVYAVFLHTDKKHRHLHIVSSRIDRVTLKKINDSHENRRSLLVRDRLMKKYNLSETIDSKLGLVSELNERIGEVMKLRPMNIGQLKRLCLDVGIKVVVTSKNGVMFQLREERPTYSSKLPIFATKETSLRQQMLNNSNASTEEKEMLSQRMEKVLDKKPYDISSLRIACAKESIKVIQKGRGVMFQLENYNPVFSGSLSVFNGEGQSLMNILKDNMIERQRGINTIKMELDTYYSHHESKDGMERYMRSKGVNVKYGDKNEIIFSHGTVAVDGERIGYGLTKIQWHENKAKNQSISIPKGQDLFERLLGGVRSVGTSDEEDEEERLERLRRKGVEI